MRTSSSSSAAWVIYWDWFEDVLASDLRQLIKWSRSPGSPAAKSAAPRTPTAFGERLKSWFQLSTKLYSRIPNYQKQCESIRDAASVIAQDRNALVHGFLRAWDPSERARVKLFHITPKNEIRNYEVDVGTLQTMSARITETTDALLSLQLNRMLATHDRGTT
jgi:hypothetical protein